MAGPGVDERAFEVLKTIRAEHGGGTSLQEFKTMVREQYFALLLDPKAALDAIPGMLAPEPGARDDVVRVLRRVVSAAGAPEGDRAERLGKMERLLESAT